MEDGQTAAPFRPRPSAFTPAPVMRPGLHDGRLVAPNGRVDELADGRLSPKRAQELVAAGAPVVFDDCGCNGYCGLGWPNDEERRRLARCSPPRVRRKRFGRLEEWRTREGSPVVFVSGDVHWG